MCVINLVHKEVVSKPQKCKSHVQILYSCYYLCMCDDHTCYMYTLCAYTYVHCRSVQCVFLADNIHT